jgi:histidine triad (HIT) family protein
MDCIFCKIVAGQMTCVKVFEDERTLAFMDINPRADGHCLVIPKNHAPTLFDISEEDLLSTMAAVKKVATAIKVSLASPGMMVYQLNGRSAGQIVDHFHVHLVPRRKNEETGFGREFQGRDQERIKAIGQKIAAAFS